MTIKIMHVIPSLLGGGAERQLVNVISNTSSEEFAHTVCVFREATFFSSQITSKGHRVIELGEKSERRWDKFARFINAQVSAEKPQIVHTWLYDANVAARFALKKRPTTKLLTSLQSPDYEPETIRAGQWNPNKVHILKSLDKLTAFLARPHFVACSRFVADSYQRELSIHKDDISVIYNSVDEKTLDGTPESSAQIRRELGIAPDEFVFVSVGRLDAAKNHAQLLRAFALTQNKIHAKLMIIGVGRLEQELKALADSLKISDRVFFLGRRSDIGDCLRAADVFVFPTLFEGLGVAVLEAMSVGIACVASDIAALREVIDNEESGLLVNPRDASQMAEAMIKLYEDKSLRERFVQQARLKVASKFSSAVTTEQWENIYRRFAE